MKSVPDIVSDLMAVAAVCGSDDALGLARGLLGFDSWAEVLPLAMDDAHPVAVELLRRLCARADS